jgi:AsmA protein
MTRIFAFAGVLVASLVVGGLVLGWLVLPSLSASGIKQAVARDTGRTVSFAGRPRLSLWPELAIELRDVELSNPPEMSEGRFAAADTVRLKVAGTSLWGTPEITEIIVVQPRINLLVDSDGHSNFAFERDGDDAAPAGQLPPIVLTDGRIKYLNERSAAAFAVSDVDMTLSRAGLAGPIELDGAFNFNDQRLNLAFYAKSSARLMAQGSPADFTLAGPYLNAAFSGRAALREGLELAGTLEFKADPLADLLAWAGGGSTSTGNLPALSAGGALDLSRGAIRLTQAKLAFGEVNAQGDVALAFDRAKPLLTATLGIDRLDLDALAGQLGGGPAQDHGGWSEAPVDLALLNILDAELSLAISEIAHGGLVAGASRLDVELADGRFDARLVEADLYGGSATGRLTLDGTGPVAALEAALEASEVDGSKIAVDLSGVERISGRADVDLDVSATGASPQELVARLRGKAHLRIRQGALAQLDIAALLDHLKMEVADGWTSAEGGQTPFSRLEASFAIADGIAETQDLTLDGPVAELAGTGSIDLVHRRLDLKVWPRLLSGRGRQPARELPVAVAVAGDWSAPKIYPDVDGILEDPETAYDLLHELIEVKASKLDLGPGTGDKSDKGPEPAVTR